MSKFLTILLLFSIIAPSNANAKEDIPSIGDIISNVLGGDNAYKSYQVIASTEKSVCVDNSRKYLNEPVDKKAFYEGWGLNCLVMNNSQLCKDIKKEDKLICDQPAKQPWYSNVWEKTKSCGSGIYKSWQDYAKFIADIGHYVMNSEKEVLDKNGKKIKAKMRTHTNEKISKAYTSMKSYMAIEMTKHQDQYGVSKSKSFFAVTSKLFSKFTKGLNQLIAKAAPKVGCYNYKSKTRVICQVLAEFFAEPILMFKFIKMGPKVLKGTRVAKFFKFHKAKTAREVAAATKKIVNKVKKIKKKPNNLDFIGAENKVAIKIMENKNLSQSVSKNKAVFGEIFPDKKSLDELDHYLTITGKEEADDLAQVLKVLSDDKAKMSPKKYNELIADIKEGIKTKCSL